LAASPPIKKGVSPEKVHRKEEKKKKKKKKEGEEQGNFTL